MNIYIFIIVTLTAFYGGMMLFYHLGWLNLKEWKPEQTKKNTKVSVIIAARNEESNIGNCLHDILLQHYPADLFEVIVIDDFSTDKTAEIVKGVSSPHIKLLQLKDFLSTQENSSSKDSNQKETVAYKKLCIECGVENATGELIVTTDADCRMNSQWLSAIVSFYESSGARFIVCPVTFTDDSTFFEKIQTLDFLGLMGITGGALSFHFPVMCNGANLAYTKKVFKEVNGFKDISNLSSGDDVFLMQKVNQKYPQSVWYLKSSQAVIQTFPQQTLKNFLHQRIRWASKSASYADKRITVILALTYLFNLMIVCNLIISFFDISFLQLFFFQLVVKMGTEFFFLLTVTRFFRRQTLLTLFLPAQLLHIIYVVVVGLLGNFTSYNWKERHTR